MLQLADGKRPDGMSLTPWLRGRCLVWDATAPDIFAHSHVSATSVKAGAAAEKASSGKYRKYDALTKDFHFIPVAGETMGVYSADAWQFIRSLGARLNVHKNDLRQSSYLLQRVSVALQRGNAASVLGTFSSHVFKS